MNPQHKWHILYYEDKKGYSEVFDFVDNRKYREKAKIFAILDLLEKQGPHLPRPYADILEDGIHELRVKLAGDQIRVLYFFCYREFIILTNVFNKTTGRVPPREINTAKKLRNDFMMRNTVESLRRNIHENL